MQKGKLDVTFTPTPRFGWGTVTEEHVVVTAAATVKTSKSARATELVFDLQNDGFKQLDRAYDLGVRVDLSDLDGEQATQRMFPRLARDKK